MSGYTAAKIIKQSALATALFFGASNAIANDNQQGTAMTAGALMERMDPNQRFVFMSGVVEGLAYARFVRDTKQSGTKEYLGMHCIYDWFYDNGVEQIDHVEAAFAKYHDQTPAVVMTAMINKECGR